MFDLVTASIQAAPFQHQSVWGVQLSWLERSPVTQNQIRSILLLMFNNERKDWLFYFTRKHRSLSRVENEIFEVEYFRFNSGVRYVPFITSFFCPIYLSRKFRALGKKSLCIYLSQLLNLYDGSKSNCKKRCLCYPRLWQ